MNKYKPIIAFLIFSIACLLYSYITNKPIIKEDLIRINGKIDDKPVYGETAGETPFPFVKIKLVNDDRKFYLKGCSFHSSAYKSVLELNTGANIKMLVQKNTKGIKSYFIYDLASDSSKFLSLEKFNDCYTSNWKRFLIFIYLSLGAFVITICYDINRWNRK